MAGRWFANWIGWADNDPAIQGLMNLRDVPERIEQTVKVLLTSVLSFPFASLKDAYNLLTANDDTIKNGMVIRLSSMLPMGLEVIYIDENRINPRTNDTLHTLYIPVHVWEQWLTLLPIYPINERDSEERTFMAAERLFITQLCLYVKKELKRDLVPITAHDMLKVQFKDKYVFHEQSGKAMLSQFKGLLEVAQGHRTEQSRLQKGFDFIIELVRRVNAIVMLEDTIAKPCVDHKRVMRITWDQKTVGESKCTLPMDNWMLVDEKAFHPALIDKFLDDPKIKEQDKQYIRHVKAAIRYLEAEYTETPWKFTGVVGARNLTFIMNWLNPAVVNYWAIGRPRKNPVSKSSEHLLNVLTLLRSNSIPLLLNSEMAKALAYRYPGRIVISLSSKFQGWLYVCGVQRGTFKNLILDVQTLTPLASFIDMPIEFWIMLRVRRHFSQDMILLNHPQLAQEIQSAVPSRAFSVDAEALMKHETTYYHSKGKSYSTKPNDMSPFQKNIIDKIVVKRNITYHHLKQLFLMMGLTEDIAYDVTARARLDNNFKFFGQKSTDPGMQEWVDYLKNAPANIVDWIFKGRSLKETLKHMMIESFVVDPIQGMEELVNKAQNIGPNNIPIPDTYLENLLMAEGDAKMPWSVDNIDASTATEVLKIFFTRYFCMQQHAEAVYPSEQKQPEAKHNGQSNQVHHMEAHDFFAYFDPKRQVIHPAYPEYTHYLTNALDIETKFASRMFADLGVVNPGSNYSNGLPSYQSSTALDALRVQQSLLPMPGVETKSDLLALVANPETKEVIDRCSLVPSNPNLAFTLDTSGRVVPRCGGPSWITRVMPNETPMYQRLIKYINDLPSTDPFASNLLNRILALNKSIGKTWMETSTKLGYKRLAMLWAWMGLVCMDASAVAAIMDKTFYDLELDRSPNLNAEQAMSREELEQTQNEVKSRADGTSTPLDCARRMEFLEYALGSSIFFPFIESEQRAQEIAAEHQGLVIMTLSQDQSGMIVLYRQKLLGEATIERKILPVSEFIDGYKYPTTAMRLRVFNELQGGICADNASYLKLLNGGVTPPGPSQYALEMRMTFSVEKRGLFDALYEQMNAEKHKKGKYSKETMEKWNEMKRNSNLVRYVNLTNQETEQLKAIEAVERKIREIQVYVHEETHKKGSPDHERELLLRKREYKTKLTSILKEVVTIQSMSSGTGLRSNANREYYQVLFDSFYKYEKVIREDIAKKYPSMSPASIANLNYAAMWDLLVPDRPYEQMQLAFPLLDLGVPIPVNLQDRDGVLDIHNENKKDAIEKWLDRTFKGAGFKVDNIKSQYSPDAIKDILAQRAAEKEQAHELEKKSRQQFELVKQHWIQSNPCTIPNADSERPTMCELVNGAIQKRSLVDWLSQILEQLCKPQIVLKPASDIPFKAAMLKVLKQYAMTIPQTDKAFQRFQMIVRKIHGVGDCADMRELYGHVQEVIEKGIQTTSTSNTVKKQLELRLTYLLFAQKYLTGMHKKTYEQFLVDTQDAVSMFFRGRLGEGNSTPEMLFSEFRQWAQKNNRPIDPYEAALFTVLCMVHFALRYRIIYKVDMVRTAVPVTF